MGTYKECQKAGLNNDYARGKGSQKKRKYVRHHTNSDDHVRHAVHQWSRQQTCSHLFVEQLLNPIMH